MMLLSALFRHPAASQLDQAEWNRKRDSEARRRQALLESGELEADDSNGLIGETHWKPRRQRWTTEEPRTPGLWFCRTADGPTRVVEVFLRHGALWFGYTDIPAAPVRGSGLRWGESPLEEPIS